MARAAASKKRPDVKGTTATANPLRNWFKSEASQVVLAAGAVTAFLYLLGVLKPIIDSGPLPVPSRQEVVDMKTGIDKEFSTISETLNQTLETAKVANQSAQQALAQTNDYRLDRLLEQKAELEAQIAKTPSDLTLRTALAHVERDLAALPMPKQ